MILLLNFSVNSRSIVEANVLSMSRCPKECAYGLARYSLQICIFDGKGPCGIRRPVDAAAQAQGPGARKREGLLLPVFG